MADNAATMASTYPLPVYNYRVEIGTEAVAFSEVSGLVIGYELGTYKESQTGNVAGPRTMYFPGQQSAVTLSLKKGLVKKISLKALYGWIKTVQTNQIDKKDVFIRLCDEKGNPVISWKAANAFPIKLTAPSFDAKSNDAAIETLDLQADFITMEES
jgi:phage tail-like protein